MGRLLYFLRATFPAAVIALTLCAPASPEPQKNLREMLFKCSGITEADVKGASSAEKIGLFGLYALSVSGTERLAIEGEAAIQADYKKWQALGKLFPSVSFKTTRYLMDEKTAGSSFKSYLNLYARQNLISGLDDYAQIKLSTHNVRQKEYSLNDAAGKLLLDVAIVYLQTMQIDRTLKNRKDVLEYYRGIAAELQRRVAVGRSRKSELLRTNSQIYKLEAEIEQMQNQYCSIRLALGTLTGLSREVIFEDVTDIPPTESLFPDPETSPGAENAPDLSRLVDSRFDVRAAAEEVSVAKAEYLMAMRGNLPSVYLEGYYRLYHEDKTGPDYYGALGAELPLVDGGVTVAKIKEAESLKRQAELRLSQVRRAALQEIQDAFATYRSSIHEMGSFKKALDAAEGDYRAVVREYGLNLVTLLDVFNALTDLASSRDDYQQSVLNHCLSRIRLGVATGEFPGKGISLLRNCSLKGKKP
ncbi:MAG TPA: TolC family protein [Spirochaetota bacterium]|nr:TolC family protein [Spirochaetota bacterium]HPI90759.1 TolC family protein [Spirochaetota bacterium]HPR49366.1 TolC family protein [Spirochaetota bacterium]